LYLYERTFFYILTNYEQDLKQKQSQQRHPTNPPQPAPTFGDFLNVSMESTVNLTSNMGVAPQQTMYSPTEDPFSAFNMTTTPTRSLDSFVDFGQNSSLEFSSFQ
jgi:hypothetical protein